MGAIARSWSTEGVETKRAFPYWVEAVSEAIFELEIDSANRDRFFGCLQQELLGAAALSRFEVEQQVVTRTGAAIARSRQTQYELVYLRKGAMSLQQAGRTAELNRGECVLFDSKQPYQFATQGETSSLTVHCPHQWLQCWMRSPDDCLAKPVTSQMPWGTPLLALLEAVAREGIDDSALPRHTVADQIAGAMVLAFGQHGSGHKVHGRKLFARVRQAIQDLAHDGEVDAARVAKMVGISTRYLHALCATAGTTYYTELLGIRLQRAEHMLSDPRFRQLSIADIAWRCGFRDPNHFTRRFRRKYAVTPGVFRSQALS